MKASIFAGIEQRAEAPPFRAMFLQDGLRLFARGEFG